MVSYWYETKEEIFMENYFKKSSLISLILSVLIFIIAICLVVAPVQVASNTVTILGYVLIAAGVSHCISYFLTRNEINLLNFEFAQSILSLILGFVLVFNPTGTIISIAAFVGIYLIVNSVFKIQLSLNIAIKKVNKWGVLLAAGVIELVFALLLMFMPFQTIKLLLIIVGSFLAITQLFDIYSDFFVLYRLNEKL
jgi:membrane protein